MAAALVQSVASQSAADWADAGGVAAQAHALRIRTVPLIELDAVRYAEALRVLAARRRARGREVSAHRLPELGVTLELGKQRVELALRPRDLRRRLDPLLRSRGERPDQGREPDFVVGGHVLMTGTL